MERCGSDICATLGSKKFHIKYDKRDKMIIYLECMEYMQLAPLHATTASACVPVHVVRARARARAYDECTHKSGTRKTIYKIG